MTTITENKPRKDLPRLSGILLHPTSLPSPYGIGDLGEEAYRFIDFLQKSGQRLWQVLPLTPTGFGDSPYQSFSAFAGQPLLISPSHLIELGLLSEADTADCPAGSSAKVDYGTIIPWKTKLLGLAYKHFCERENAELAKAYTAFYSKNQFWLDDYALFMTCKELNNGESWLYWEEKYRTPSPAFKEHLRCTYRTQLEYYYFVQFLFFREWYALKAYANEKQIEIVGDIPIFVSMDSADVWANPKLFQLDSSGFPTVVAGVPPDYFSATGQLWGNPLYDWDMHKQTHYRWWILRLKSQLEMFDYLRIDHFRGFESYWAVPYGEETAICGSWKQGPGAELFLAIERALGDDLPIIAEDLGIITPQVEALRDRFGFPGMKVLQFAFENASDESSFLPHRFTDTNCVCYTGTHDNDTTAGWFETACKDSQDKVCRYMNSNGCRISIDFIRVCMGTIAAYAIYPLQDALCLGKEGRMNIPGVAADNWNWRYLREDLTDELAEELRELAHLYGRY